MKNYHNLSLISTYYYLLLLAAFLSVSCSSYKWVDLEDCTEKVGTLGKCKEVE